MSSFINKGINYALDTARNIVDPLKQSNPSLATNIPGYPTHQATSTTNIPVYPTPSFINKEANYASNTLERFVDLRHSKSQDGSDFENQHQRTIKNSKPEYGSRESRGSQGVQKINNVFPGTYSYGEDPTGHESTQSLSHWKREDASLLKEMPEYSPKANTIESNTQPGGHYTVLTFEKDSAAEIKPQVTKIASSDNNKGLNERFHGLSQNVRNQLGDTTSELNSQTVKIADSDANTGVREFRPASEELQQPIPSALENTGSEVHPQTSDIAASNNDEMEPGNELNNAQVANIVSQFGNKEIGKNMYENAESLQYQLNHIGDMHKIQARHYNMLTSREESNELDPQGTNTADNEDYATAKSQQPIGDEVDGAFEVVEGGQVPTLRRTTGNPEDGVEDKTFINGDEYHLQKKHGIARKDTSRHV